MTEYDNSNRGALFKNDRKEKETHPDYKGSLNVGGVDYWLSSWISKSKAGATYMSLSIQPKEAPAAKAAASGNSATVASGTDFEPDSEIPF
jgi:hypothetical protein